MPKPERWQKEVVLTEQNGLREVYLKALQEAADDIARMKDAKKRGEDLSPGLPDQVSGPISFRFLDDLPSRSGENDAWDVEFVWEDGSSHATFTIWFAPSQNIGGDEPNVGWVSWVDGDLLLAFIDYNGPAHDAIHLQNGSPFQRGEGEQKGAAWLRLARSLLRLMFNETDAHRLVETS